MSDHKEPMLIEFDSAMEVRRGGGHTTIRLGRNTGGILEPVADIRCTDESAKQMADVIHVAISPPV